MPVLNILRMLVPCARWLVTMQLSLRSADDVQDVLDAISEELNTGQFEQFTFEDPLLKVCLPVDRQIK